MNRGVFFLNGVFLVVLPTETFDEAGENPMVAAIDRRAVVAASWNFMLSLLVNVKKMNIVKIIKYQVCCKLVLCVWM